MNKVCDAAALAPEQPCVMLLHFRNSDMVTFHPAKVGIDVAIQVLRLFALLCTLQTAKGGAHRPAA